MRYVKSSKINKHILWGVVLFFVFSYLIVPLIHELGHILFLKIFGCNYWTKFEYEWLNNIYGKVYSRCDLTQMQEAMVYLGGVALTFLIGIILLGYDVYLNKKHRFEESIIVSFISFAFLLDLVNYLFYPAGDIKEFLIIIKRPYMLSYAPIVGVLLIILLLTYLFINISREMNIKVIEESIDKELHKGERFLKRILKRIKRSSSH